ncbi:MAG: hypothetical protein U5Q44_08815 [Dehalococcoidia bacterium]|nr:hypothetical protein [Dehalococcoidia bacterium]
MNVGENDPGWRNTQRGESDNRVSGSGPACRYSVCIGQGLDAAGFEPLQPLVAAGLHAQIKLATAADAVGRGEAGAFEAAACAFVPFQRVQDEAAEVLTDPEVVDERGDGFGANAVAAVVELAKQPAPISAV